MSGSIKTYTPNFNMIIPEFNVATWHDYIEENFRSIDALFHNLFGINGFSGMWKTNSQYTNGQVLFVGEDNGSIYEGRLVKVIQDTNTAGFVTFSDAIRRYPNHYELYADASSAEIFALLAQDWATKTGSTIKTPTGEDTGEYSAKHHAQLAAQHEEACEMYKNLAKTEADLAKDSETYAADQAQIATTQAANAATSATNAKTSETNAKTSENTALSYKNSAQSSATSAQTSAQDAEDSAIIATNAANSSNVQTVVTNMSAINNCSTNMSVIKDAPNQANRAKLYADQAQILTEGSLNTTQITNCITYIPQDIKLEFTDSTIILKAGSKICNPKSAGVFDVVTIEEDIVITGAVNRNTMVFIKDGTSFQRMAVSNCYSGTTAPTLTSVFGIWYDLSANEIKFTNDSGSTWISGYSLPIFIATETTSGFTSIDQVFNGFGYIGSTVFALPGVKLLIPNDRNEDGTLKSIEVEFDTVKTGTLSYGAQDYYLCVSKNKNFVFAGKKITEYHESKNRLYDVFAGSYREWGIVGGIRGDANNILSNFQPKTTFHAVDYNDAVKYSDKAEVVGWGMPDYSAAVSVSNNFVCPSDGYIGVYAYDNGNIDYTISNGTVNIHISANSASSQNDACFAQVEKGFILTQNRKSGNSSISFYPMKGVQ